MGRVSYILRFFLQPPVRVFPKLPPGALAEFRSSWSASASRRTRLASRMVFSSERTRFTTCGIMGPLELWGWIKVARDAYIYIYILHHVRYCQTLSDIVRYCHVYIICIYIYNYIYIYTHIISSKENAAGQLVSLCKHPKASRHGLRTEASRG